MRAYIDERSAVAPFFLGQIALEAKYVSGTDLDRTRAAIQWFGRSAGMGEQRAHAEEQRKYTRPK